MPSPDEIRILVLIVPLLLLLVGFLWRPVFAVSAYMLLVYCKASNYYPFFSAISAESLFAILIIIRIAIAGNLLSNLSISASKINKYIFLFIGSVFLSFTMAWDYKISWDYGVYHFIKTIILYIMIVGAVDTESDLKIFLWSFFLMFLYLAYEPFYGYLHGIGGSEHTYGTNYIGGEGLLSGHVALANNMNQMLPLVFYMFFVTKKKLWHFGVICCLFVFFVALVGSGSRGGVVGATIMGILIVWYSKHRVKAALVAGILLVIVLVFAGSSLLYTAGRIDGASTSGRMLGLTHGLGMLVKGHILGVGPGCFAVARADIFGWRLDAHNLYGEIMGELGVPGLITAYLLIREVFRTLLGIKNRFSSEIAEEKFWFFLMLGVQVSLITRLVISMASHGIFFFYWYVMFAIVVVAQRITAHKSQGGAVEITNV